MQVGFHAHAKGIGNASVEMEGFSLEAEASFACAVQMPCHLPQYRAEPIALKMQMLLEAMVQTTDLDDPTVSHPCEGRDSRGFLKQGPSILSIRLIVGQSV